MIQFIKKNQNYVKAIFVIAVAFIALTQISAMLKQVRPDRVRLIFDNLSLLDIVLVILTGLISVVPMLNYDRLLNQLIGTHYSLKKWLPASWLINTLNNIAGFGGAVSVGLRSQFYGKEVKEKLMSNISKVFFFALSGLSLYGLIGFILIRTGQVDAFLGQYSDWLIGAIAYFIIVVGFTRKRLGGMRAGLQIELLLTSFLEWTGVMVTFIVIGHVLNVNISMPSLIVLVTASSVIGILSMIPGSLGSFDVMMMLGLLHFGVPKEVVLIWLLIYRFAYYLFPLMIGFLVWVMLAGRQFDARYSGIPINLSREILHKVVTFLTAITGGLLVLSATVPEAFAQWHWLRQISPWNANLIAESPKIILGFLLIITSRAVKNRVSRAYVPTLVIELLTVVYIFLDDFSWYSIGLMTTLLLLTIFVKRELYREQLVMSYETLIVDGFLTVLLMLLYIYVGTMSHPNYHTHHRIKNFLLFPSEKIWFSGLIAIFIVAGVWLIYLRYLKGKALKVGTELDVNLAHDILTTYGGNTQSQLLFMGDKRMWVYDHRLLIQFAIRQDKILVMGTPSGDLTCLTEALNAFIQESDHLGYLPVFYEIDEKTTLILHELGYHFIKQGEEGHVDLTEFTLTGTKNKTKRQAVNQVEKSGYRFEIVTETEMTPAFFTQLKTISDDWLGGRREKGFSLGYFDRAYLSQAPIAIVRSSNEEIVAFANIMPTYTQEFVTIDLMRHSQNAPKGVMDFMFIKLFAYYQAQGFTKFDLGMTPLANVGTSRSAFVSERIANLIYQFGDSLYNFEGLRNYKKKYVTSWESRYTAYSHNANIAFVMLALLLQDNQPVIAKKDKEK